MKRVTRIFFYIIALSCMLLLLTSCGTFSDGTVQVTLSEAPAASTPHFSEATSSQSPKTTSSQSPDATSSQSSEATLPEFPVPTLDESGSYTSKEDVSLYLHTYGRLPDNFISKSEARALGWEGGGLESFASGKCIGGDRFGNYEGLLPKKHERLYTECDINTLGKSSRGAKRIVFSNDGLIYYTDDHYESFVLLYGEENK